MVGIYVAECPKSMYSIKCPYTMKPSRIVIHNTANNASAEDEIAYMQSNGNKVSFHYAVDDKVAIRGLPLDRNSFNAGDSAGKGNREGISIEICYSYCQKKVNGKWVADEDRWKRDFKSKFEQAQKNAAMLTAHLLREYGWGIDKVTKHQDYNGKYCPHRTLSDYGWDYFLKLVQYYLDTESTDTKNKKSVADKEKNKTIDELAKEALNGKWGNGDERKKNLKAAGYDYDKVQARVNELLTSSKPKTYKKGDKVVLTREKLYSSSTSTSTKKTVSGTYYIYDGEKINGRYRITNKASRCGKKPVGLFVTGYVEI